MPNPPLSHELMQEAIDLWREHNKSVRKAADASGLKYYAYCHRLEKAKKLGMHLSDGVKDSMTRAGLDPLVIRGGHRRVYDNDGKQIDTVRYTVEQDIAAISDEIEQATQSAIDRINTAEPTSPTLIRVKPADGALFGLLPLFDAHIGLQMPSYGLDEAVARLVGAAFEAIDAMPAAGCIAIINGGDFTHQNDDSNQTPQSRHPLPISANYLDTTDAATDARIAIIEHAAKKFDCVETKDLIGNHDPATAKIVRAALRQRYRDCDRVHVDLEGVTHWSRVFGENLLTAHHGDIRRQLKDLALSLGSKYRVERGVTKVHEHHTGHLHHIKETRLDIGGVMLCQHAAISIKSNYDAANFYESSSIVQAITYRETGGRKSTYEVHLD
jgi:hypothetical protein